MILARVVWLDPPLIGARIPSLRFLTRRTSVPLPRASPNVRIICIRWIAKIITCSLGMFPLRIASTTSDTRTFIGREGVDYRQAPHKRPPPLSLHHPTTFIDHQQPRSTTQFSLFLLSSLNRRLKPGLDHPPPSSPSSLQLNSSTLPPRHTTSHPSFHRQPWLTTTRIRRGS